MRREERPSDEGGADDGLGFGEIPWLSILLGLALLFAWGVVSLAHAYARGLAKVTDSFTPGFHSRGAARRHA